MACKLPFLLEISHNKVNTFFQCIPRRLYAVSLTFSLSYSINTRKFFFFVCYKFSFFMLKKIHIIRKHLQVLTGSSYIITSSLTLNPESFLMPVKKEKDLDHFTARPPGEVSNWMWFMEKWSFTRSNFVI